MKKTLYILQDGRLHRKDNSLYFESAKGRKFIPVENTNDIYILGEVNVSKRFLEFASQKQICVHYFDKHGIYIGTYYPREHYSSGHIIVKQVEHCIDNKRRIILARSFVDGDIGQKIRVLKYYSTRVLVQNRETLNELIFQLEIVRNKAENVSTNEELETIIQLTKEIYNSAFNCIFSNPHFISSKTKVDIGYKRRKALAEFGKYMCHSMILSEIYKTYLDPRIGYLHIPDSRRFVLNLDVFYVFQSIMVDRLILRLVNKRIITKDDLVQFESEIRLSKDGKRKFVKQLDNWMRTTVNHRHLGRHVSYRRLIRLELYKIQKHILGEKIYKPYQALW